METLLGTSPAVFLVLTVILAGGAAMLTGQAVAQNWKPLGQVLAAALGLSLADRFLVFALFDGPLLSIPGLISAFVVLALIGFLSWQTSRAAAFVRQYPWRYERASPFSFRDKAQP